MLQTIIAVVAATFAVVFLGYLWFALLFERQYAIVLGREAEPKTNMPPLFIAGPALCVLVTAMTSAYLMKAQRIGTLAEAMGFGVIVGIGYLGATAMNMAINPNIPRPIIYGLLSMAYFVVASVIISSIIYLIA